ncbi:MAG: type II toxin-antitoxin system VapC family toxin [Dehalococcoidia bacterium]|nr:type II toxin-antitoxin system VapC family toxin [Dehalococcoidia bacterium]
MAATVVDASVVAALVFNEPRANDAAVLVTDGELHAPTLLGYEMANVALQKTRRTPAMGGAYAIALNRVFRMGIRFEDVPYEAVYRLATQTSLSAYDASYLYLARLLGAELVTFDRRLQAVAGGL